MTLQILSQRDPRWSGVTIGTSNVTIGSHGCTITCLAMAAGLTPDEINSRLLKVNGYANGNLVIWSKISEAIPTLSNGIRSNVYDNDKVKEAISKNGFCLVEVDGARIGASRHWCLYIGNGQMHDPWFGTQKSTSYYPPVGYAIIDRLVPATQSQCEKDLAEQRQQVSNLQTQVNGLLNDIAGLKGALSAEETKNGTSSGRIQELTKQNDDLSSQLGSANSTIQALTSKVESLNTIVGQYQKEDAVQIKDLRDAQDKQKVVEDQYSLTLYEAEEILKLQHTSDALQVRAVAVLDALQKLRDGKEKQLDTRDYQLLLVIGGTVWLKK